MIDYDRLLPQIIRKGENDICALNDAFQLCRELEREGCITVCMPNGEEQEILDENNQRKAHIFNRDIRKIAKDLMPVYGDKAVRQYRRSLLFDAPIDFDAYCTYIELDRAKEKKFYLPRRPQLLPLVEALQQLETGELEILGISLPPGVGKALANDTPILTRNGWKNHGDLVVGDEVIGLDGRFKKVIAVHPKCMLDRLVEFTNGEKIQCHENHEWMLYDRHALRTHTEETKYWENRGIETNDIPCGKRGHRYFLQLPKKRYVHGEHKDLPLDPYTFGVWLGDGANKNPRICNVDADKAIIDKIAEKYPIRWSTRHKTTGVMYYDFDIRKSLRGMGLCHSRRINPKYIPDEYLTADVGQRLQLLAGLLDTDGTLCRETGKYTFTTSEETLRDSFVQLVSTFGWRCCVRTIEPTTSTSGITGRKQHYIIIFSPGTDIPCALPRKRLRVYTKQRAIAIKSITKVEPKEGNCITVEGDGMYLAGHTMLPTHNTTLAIFYLTWISGRRPELQSLVGSHNNDFLRGLYDECKRIMMPGGEYLWADVFPGLKISGTNAKDLRIDLGKPKRFQTLEMTSIGSGNAGKVRATHLLYCDDLVEGIEQAMSRDQMEKLWQKYTVDLRQRKQGDVVKELHIATRWSLIDPIGRLENIYGNDGKRALFINIPALDEDGNSNFNYPYGVGFTTDMYNDLKQSMDDASWRALYMGSPIEREGQLYPPDELRRYFELPEGEPDAVYAVADTKDTGADYFCMPIVYQYGNDYYVEEILCDNGRMEAVESAAVEMLIKHKVKLARFESNRGGARSAEDVQSALDRQGGITHITTKYNTTNKETRIQVSQPWVKNHCIFKDESRYDRQYRTAMSFLCGYTMMGKNKFDDVPDAFADLADFVQGMGQRGKGIIMNRFF